VIGPRNRIEVLHGVNLDMLGKRDHQHYGTLTLIELEVRIRHWARALGLETSFFHTNFEGEYVERLHQATELADGLVLNPGAWTHYSYAVRDALEMTGTPAVEVSVTGAAAMWSDFNESNREAMLRSELISWPVTLAIMLLAFGSLVAAGLPLMLTMVGLVAAAGLLYLATLVLPISIWAMNFALMFALALGIDYALFVLQRFRATRSDPELSAVEATALTMDSAGTAVLFSGITVLISLTAVVLVPSPAFRSMSLGIGLAVVLVLAAALTLLPAALARLDARVDKLSLPWARPHRHGSARAAAWGERLWRHPLAYGAAAVAVLVALAVPAIGIETSMPSINPASAAFALGTSRVPQPARRAACAITIAPRTPRTEPSSPSSPHTAHDASRSLPT